MRHNTFKIISGSTGTPARDRIWELDFLRGIALILMIYFHIIYDLKEMCGLKVSYEGNFNAVVGKSAAVLFLTISGICASFCRNNLKRGLKVLSASLLVTIASYLYNPSNVIIFGILQLIGTSMILSHTLKRVNRYLLLLLGTLLVTAGFFTSGVGMHNDYLLILGLKSFGYSSFDYYPLIPWFGVFLFGMALGKELYSLRKSILRLYPASGFISTAGRHTLSIYFIHQPVIIVLLKVFAPIFLSG